MAHGVNSFQGEWGGCMENQEEEENSLFFYDVFFASCLRGR